MMNRKDFYEYVKNNVKGYLPPSYESGEITIREFTRNNGIKLTGITIPEGEQRVVPTVYLDSVYQQYAKGRDLDACVGDVADMRIEAQDKAVFISMGLPDIYNYEEMKEKLQVRICDPEWNKEQLADKVFTEHGDFAAYYTINMEEQERGIFSVPVTVELMKEWGVSVEQIHADATAADRNRGVMLMNMNDIMDSLIFGSSEPQNMLHEQLNMDEIEQPMFCLTNKAKMNGASLLLQEDIRKQIGECLGCDYFVLPSSLHEVLILPDNGFFEVPALNEMVKEVNETEVEPQDRLSDKVQFCDGKSAVMENAARREARLAKAKEAEMAKEQATEKGGIHGKLEKVKNEIKSKETTRVPMDKGRDLATVL